MLVIQRSEVVSIVLVLLRRVYCYGCCKRSRNCKPVHTKKEKHIPWANRDIRRRLGLDLSFEIASESDTLCLRFPGDFRPSAKPEDLSWLQDVPFDLLREKHRWRSTESRHDASSLRQKCA